MRAEIRAVYLPQSNNIGLFLTQKWEENGKTITAQCTNIEMKVETESDRGMRRDPLISIETKEAQKLVDSLWECGIRPTQGQGTAGQLGATQEHLKDLKTLLWHSAGLGQGTPPLP